MIFQKSTKKQHVSDFFIGNKPIEKTQEYTYLGLKLSSNGSFTQAIKTLADKGTQAPFLIKKKANFSNLKPKLAIKIFNSITHPIIQLGDMGWI
jgi:hypothetical protein